MYNANRKPLLYNKIHCKHPAKSHPHPFIFVRKSAQSPRLKIFYFLHFLPICNDILQQVNHCIFTFLHYMDDYWVIFYVLTHINQKIYLFYNQIVVYLHNEDKEHRYMYLAFTDKRKKVIFIKCAYRSMRYVLLNTK